MPPSKKKASRSSSSASKLSHTGSDQSATSPWTPKPTGSGAELGEDELMNTLEEASSKYPSLIGKTALIGRLIGEVKQEAKGFKLWLSESSMIASSISPGSRVSVSLASSRKCITGRAPLRSLLEECVGHFGFSSDDKMVHEVGTFFILATAFPSCKLQKDEVRLSSNLSCAMGYPASGRITFVYPIDYQFKVSPENGNAKLQRDAVSSLSVYKCKDLHLAFVASEGGVVVNSGASYQIESLTGKTQDRADNGNISSPKRPLFLQSRTSSPSASQLTSPRYTDSASKMYDPFQTTFKPFDIREVLQDECGKNLLQTCATSLLSSLHLLCGNVIMIPILTERCIFQVVSASKMSENIGTQNVIGEDNHDLFRQAPDMLDHVKDAFLIDRGTKVHLISPLSSELKPPRKQGLLLQLESEDSSADARTNFSNLGGLSKEYSILKDIIISSSVKGTFSSMGLRPTKGVLLHGPPGTGKTSLARLCARDAGVNLFSVNGPEVISQYHGESEQALHDVFDSASRSAPAVVFIDELDAIAPSRKEGGDELSLRMVATLLNLMDGIGRTEGILVIAATNRPDSIEPAIRRPGRLDREIEIGVPSPSQRHDILLTLLEEREHSLSDMEIQHLAISTHGFVGADLAALCNEAALVCLRRHISSCSESFLGGSSILHNGIANGIMKASGCSEVIEDLSEDNMESSSSSIPEFPVSCEILMGANGKEYSNCMPKENILSVTYKDFEKARMKVRPSAMREVILEVPKVSWDDVGGQKEVKMQLMEAVQWPQKHQDAFKRIGTRPPTGVLLFGPPGCSKTLLARAVASEAGLNFLAVKGPELFSKWVGESEKAVRSLFAKARANAPSIIFFDEIDGLAVIRGKESDGVSVSDRVMSQLLVEMDGLHQRVDVTVIAATNRPDKIDSALLRPGRFDRLLYVGPPDESDREDIFRVHLRKMPCSSYVCVKQLAALTKGYTGADISLICREAAIAAIEESLDASEITMVHLKSAVKQVQPSTVESYHELSAKFQRLVLSATSNDELVSQPSSTRSRWIPFW